MIKLQKPNKHEPIRQHYIPQFILRNFCFDDSNSLFFYSLKDKTVSVKNTRDVFMEKQLYNSSFESELIVWLMKTKRILML